MTQLLFINGKIVFLLCGLLATLFGLGIPLAIIWATKVVDSGLTPSNKVPWIILCLIIVVVMVGLVCSLFGFSTSGPILLN